MQTDIEKPKSKILKRGEKDVSNSLHQKGPLYDCKCSNIDIPLGRIKELPELKIPYLQGVKESSGIGVTIQKYKIGKITLFFPE